MTYKLETLPKEAREVISKVHYLTNTKEYRENSSKATEKDDVGLFAAFLDDDSNNSVKAETETTDVIWATDNYELKGDGYGFMEPINDVTVIIPRVEKTKEEQKRRVKEKAEVFTPSWVCNLQNNLVDDELLGKGSFNNMSADERTWVPSNGVISFDNYKGGTWKQFVQERRLEMACGEGPYLMSPYDTTTGDHIPVRDADGLFQRIGVLDRKLRVVTENSYLEDWRDYSLIALCSTFGYEWQGDNLLLARLNFVNTYVDYYEAVFGDLPTDDEILTVSSIASWNLWQMDGLKMVSPNSCSESCVSCLKKKRTGHDGQIAVTRFISPDGFVVEPFESFFPANY